MRRNLQTRRSDDKIFLRSSALMATRDSMALCSSVLNFDIVELWSETPNGDLKCLLIHSEPSDATQYPHLISTPSLKESHEVSPRLCALARDSIENYTWTMDPS